MRDMDRKREHDRQRGRWRTAEGKRVPDSVRALTMNAEQLDRQRVRHWRHDQWRTAWRRWQRLDLDKVRATMALLEAQEPGWDVRLAAAAPKAPPALQVSA